MSLQITSSNISITGKTQFLGDPNMNGSPSITGTITASSPNVSNAVLNYSVTNIDGYTVSDGFEISATSNIGSNVSIVTTTASATITMENLSPSSTYTFTVYSYNKLGRSRTGVVSNQVATLNPVIPTGTIILYNGTDPSNASWPRYSAADNLYLQGTTTQAEIGTSTSPSTNVSYEYSLGVTGAHTSTSGYTFNSSITAGAISAIPNNPAGDHNHGLSISPATVTNARPHTGNVTLLRASSNQTTFPTNTIHINSSNKNGWTQKLATTYKRYVRGVSTGVAEVAAIAASVSGTTGSDGQHDHVLGGVRSSSSTGSGVVNTASGTGQIHNHSVTVEVTPDSIKGKLFKMWIAASADPGFGTTMVMYDGTLSTLPSYWKLCDGANGTVDMRGYFLGYSTSASEHAVETANTLTVYSSGAYGDWTHQHATAVTTGNSYRVDTTGHQSQGFSHTHTVTAISGSTSHDPGTYRVAFIQLS
jgi:hypothetical protein